MAGFRSASSSRPRPQGGGFEAAVWYLMRVSGLALFVLALMHFTITHFLSDPANQDVTWIVNRWGSLLWRTIDWLMLTMVVFHSFMGVRTVLQDYTRGGVRLLLTSVLYVLAILLFLMGTIAVATLEFPVK
jgi:succinate dehydrogenase / fumarate reductase, membrane anchor subunit